MEDMVSEIVGKTASVLVLSLLLVIGSAGADDPAVEHEAGSRSRDFAGGQRARPDRRRGRKTGRVEVRGGAGVAAAQHRRRFQWANRTENLAALGIQFNSPFPGFQIPTFVGPYNVVDLRGNATQSVLDMSSIRRYQGSKRGIDAAKSDLANTSDQVAARSRARMSRCIARRCRRRGHAGQRRAGAGAGQARREPAGGRNGHGPRGHARRSATRQRAAAPRGGARTIASEPGCNCCASWACGSTPPVELTDKLSYVPADAQRVEAAKTVALKDRSDLKAQLSREQVGQVQRERDQATNAFPTIAGFGDYRRHRHRDRQFAVRRATIGISVRIPVFDGGRRDARRAEAHSHIGRRRSGPATSGSRSSSRFDWRSTQLHSADEQVKVAKEGLGLVRARIRAGARRYEAGMASGVEVTDAQTRLERARDNYTAALFAHNVARIDLALARGRVAEALLTAGRDPRSQGCESEF